MSQRRKNTYLFTDTAVLLCIIFLVCFVSTPSISNISGRYSVSGKISGVSGRKAYLTDDFTLNEIFNDIENTLTVNRNIQSFQNVILRIFNIVFPFAGFCLFVCYFGHFNRKKRQQKHILATSIGGHAPPID